MITAVLFFACCCLFSAFCIIITNGKGIPRWLMVIHFVSIFIIIWWLLP